MPKKEAKSRSNSKKTVEDALREFLLGESVAEAQDPDTMIKHVGQFNLKGLASKFAHMDSTNLNWTELYKHLMFGNHIDYLEDLRTRRLGLLDQLTKYEKTVDSRNFVHLPHHGREYIDLMTMIDELMASLTAKTGLQQDVVANLLVKILSDAIAPIVKEKNK